MILEIGNIEEFFLRFLQREDILQDTREKLLVDMTKAYPGFEEGNRIIVHQLIESIESNPQKILDIVKGSLLDAQNITTLIVNRESIAKERKSLFEKIKFISIFHELRSFLRLGGFLLNGQVLPLESEKKAEVLYETYSIIGLDFDFGLIRNIRNAGSHRFHFEGNSLVDDRGREVADHVMIDKVYNKLVVLWSWYSTFLFTACYRVPKFGVLIGNTCYHEISENKTLYSSYYEGLKIVAPSFFQKKKIIKEEPPKIDGSFSSYFRRAKYHFKEAMTIKITTEVRLSKNRYNNIPLYKQNLLGIEQNLDRQLKLICGYLSDLKIKDEKDKERIEKSIGLLTMKLSKNDLG